MKKALALSLIVFLAACSTANKNTLSYKLSKVDSEKYLTAASSGSTKKIASENAREEINKRLVAAGGNGQLVSDISNHAFIKETWRDKDSRQFFAIAALERKVGKKMIEGEIGVLDGQLDGLSKLMAASDKFGAIKTALKIQPLIEQRNNLQNLYEVLDYNGQGFDAERYAHLKTALYDALGRIKISLNVIGKNSNILHSHIINAVNEMGLSVAMNEPADIAIEVNSEINEYPSTVVNGLMWCRATTTVSLKDTATGGIFSTFHISDRQGSSRAEEAVERTMNSIGKMAAEEMKPRIMNYLARR